LTYKFHIKAFRKNVQAMRLYISLWSIANNELRIATKNFAKERKLGAGAYGVVYKVIKFNVIGFQKICTHVALLGICVYDTKLKDIH
jgi:hypothetical protein